MSYNIDTFKLKKVHMVLPLGFNMEENFPDKAQGNIEVDSDVKTWHYNEGGEGLFMGGTVELGKGLIVDDIHCSGEGSGHDYEDILKPLFEKFKGNLEVSLVWEGGDSINKTSIINGVVTEEDIDI